MQETYRFSGSVLREAQSHGGRQKQGQQMNLKTLTPTGTANTKNTIAFSQINIKSHIKSLISSIIITYHSMLSFQQNVTWNAKAK